MTIGQQVMIVKTEESATVIANDARNGGKFTVEDSDGHQNWFYSHELKELEKISKGT